MTNFNEGYGPVPEKVGSEDTSQRDAEEAMLAEVDARLRAEEAESNQEDVARAKLAADILSSREPCGTYDTSNLPLLLADYVDSVCQTTDADPVLIVIALITTISGLIKKRIFIPEHIYADPNSDGYFQRLYAIIWSLTINPSGAFKTSGLDKGAAFALKHDIQILNEIKRIKKDIDLLKDEEEAARIKREIAKLDRRRAVFPNKITIEALYLRLSQGHSGTVLHSEFGAWVGGDLKASYNKGSKEAFTGLFDSPEIFQYSTISKGDQIIREPFISICGVSTIQWVQENIRLSDVGSGFFARFLLFVPPQKFKIPPALPEKNRGVDRDAEDRINQILDSLGDTPRAYGLSVPAKNAFKDYHQSLYIEHEKLPEQSRELLSPYLKRWSPYVLKIAMLLQFFEDPNQDKIGTKALKGSISIVEYAIRSTVHLFQNELGETPYQQKCRKILEFIAKRNGSVKRKKLIESKLLDSAKQYDDFLETLEAQGRIEFVQEGKKTNWTIRLVNYQ